MKLVNTERAMKKLFTGQIFRLIISFLLLALPGALALAINFSPHLSTLFLVILVFSAIAALMLFLSDVFTMARTKYKKA
jgi:hypothetical protein